MSHTFLCNVCMILN